MSGIIKRDASSGIYDRMRRFQAGHSYRQQLQKQQLEVTSSKRQKSAEATTDGKTYNVGICQLVQHVALDHVPRSLRMH